jgi:GH25 family lysozyme M1 (1,4-beta-N-acetylmuramidase)
MKAYCRSYSRFSLGQATEGDNIISPNLSSQYDGASQAGLIRGGYHSAHPGRSSGEAQANYFAEHGGGWSGDGEKLPEMLELESGSGGDCWGLSATAMVSWIKSFSDQYHARQGVYPMLYTSMTWWERCTGNSMAFANSNPLVLAKYSSGVTAVPGGWSSYAIWQNATVYGYGGNSDIFNGNEAAPRTFAPGTG